MKSKQSIRILISLMSIALIGVILIQFLWIKNVLRLKQEQFDRNVTAALIRVSADLENKYGVHLITEKLRADSSVRKEVLKQDPGFYRFIVSVNQNKAKGGEIENNGNQQEAGFAYAYSSSENIESQNIEPANVEVSSRTNQDNVITTVNVHNSQNAQPLIKRNALFNPPVQNPPPPPEAPEPVVQGPVSQASKFMNIMQCAADEYALSKMSSKTIEDVIDSGKIDAAIKKEFAIQGLPQDFVFATYCVDGDTLMINHASSASPLSDYAYQSPLLATDFIEANSLLLLNFPKRYQYMLSSLAGMLALSLFFTLTIISAFAYSLHVIFRQKKLSDITNDFINNMTHELKTPLATISLTADTLGLESVSKNPDVVSEYSGMIKNEVKKLSHHVDRILDAAVLEKNKPDSRVEIVSLNQLIEEEVKVFESVVRQKNGKIYASLPEESIRVHANKDLLQGTICNLLDNAVKYSNQIPEINVSLHRVAGNVILCVADNGIGIGNADKKLIFEKFYRAPTGNRHDVKGFGLGLNFVKHVIESMGGKIWVESEPGRGSKFFAEFPIV